METGDMKDVNLVPPIKTSGLTREEAESVKKLLEESLWAQFYIVRDNDD
jgi:hypothetical protein